MNGESYGQFLYSVVWPNRRRKGKKGSGAMAPRKPSKPRAARNASVRELGQSVIVFRPAGKGEIRPKQPILKKAEAKEAPQFEKKGKKKKKN